MRNLSVLLISILAVGCGSKPERVFVDLDKVAVTIPVKPKFQAIQPSVSSASSSAPKTIPGEPATEVENLRGEQKQAIRDEVERETRSAIATITERLRDYYQREVDDFYADQQKALAPFKEKLDQDYLDKLRAIFEESAKKRGPVLTRLSFLTEFPPPEKLVPIEGEDLTKREKAKREEIRDLQRQMAQIDREYDDAVSKLDGGNVEALLKEATRLQDLLKAKQKEIDDKAAKEATQLVRRFSSGLSERIFSRYTFQLREIPTKTVNFPQIGAQPGVPGVPFDRAQIDQDDKLALTKELEAFLSLNHYERSPNPADSRDVTAEFIEWRTNLKSGHWENWQKPSKPK
ncbi:MAG: hypothetical protein JST12_16950 [Armatimonadetes bacterium]|nr:hypothetical protein [Armatimonadota bacterium]MBS1703353.1 hypothetical protein [Armatimonadota bacterium]MBS1729107.1 hypothetical protein [Armatimonadota bacterium]